MITKRALVAAAILGGAIFGTGFPPVGVPASLLCGLIMLAWLVSQCTTPKQAALGGWLWGTSALLIAFSFVPPVIGRFTPLGTGVGVIALVLLASAQALAWAAASASAVWLRNHTRVGLSLSFAASVYAALFLPAVFYWSPAGMLSPWTVFLQPAEVIGERGVSFLLALFSAFFAELASPNGFSTQRRRLVHAVVVSSGVALWLGGGLFRMRQISAEPCARAEVALLNHGLDAELRWKPAQAPLILTRLRELTAEAERRGAELTVWPEAAYPYIGARPLDGAKLNILGKDLRGPVLAGLITRDDATLDEQGHAARYNSATIVSRGPSPSAPQHLEPPQDKMFMLLFGERIPGADLFPVLRRWFQKSGGFSAGRAPVGLPVVLDGERRTAGVLNCFEDTLSDAARAIDTVAPDFIVNITNDAWFEGSAESEDHARLATVRAIELRKDLVRAVNHGVMTWVDRSGQVAARRATPGILMARPCVTPRASTIYSRFGDAPLSAGLALALLGGGIARRRITPLRRDP